MNSIDLLHRPGGFRRVIVVTGHMTDAPDRPTPRFPESEVARVRAEVAELFKQWKIGANDLLICGAARGGDLIAGTEARRCGAAVWALLAEPAEQFVEGSVVGADPGWVDEFWHLLQRTPSWDIGQSSEFANRDDIYAATNDWMLTTSAAQASGSQLSLLSVWDGSGTGATGGAADMVKTAKSRGATVVRIDPRPKPK